jgi:LacI family transcriptional regulator
MAMRVNLNIAHRSNRCRIGNVSHEPSQPAGIRQIAESLGISIGTVDRALHARPGVSAKTRDRVLKMAAKLKYSPNAAARNLRLNKRLRIGVFLPQQIDSFYEPLREGIRDSATAWTGSGIDLIFHTYPRLGEGEFEALKAAEWENFDGVILAPGNPSKIAMLPRNPQRNTALVYVSSDAPRSARLMSVAVDAVVSGGIAAELLGHKIARRALVATFTGDLKIQDHADKLRGFAASLATLAPHLSLLPAIESHDRPDDAYSSALAVFQKHLNIGGVYINTANSLPVLRAAEEAGLLGKVRIITTDLFPELVPFIESGAVLATLYQRPLTQGRMAFEALARYLTVGTSPNQVARLAPHIVLRSNLSLFTGFMSQEDQSPS